ncbi:MAG: hypothetical protein M3Z75_05700 [Actinomycetota bacterium]|nr:hypothetical protein [Actinomycetota bacterium]
MSEKRVLFRPLAEGFDSPEFRHYADQHPVLTLGIRPEVRARRWGPLALVECDDHVEWTDGKRESRWRLPDQPGGADYPVLHTVVIAELKDRSSTAPGVLLPPVYLGLFADGEGRVLAFIGPSLTRAQRALVSHPLGIMRFEWDVLFPSAAFAALEERGVRVLEEFFAGDQQLYAAHPDPRMGDRESWLLRHSKAAGPIGALVLIAIIAGIWVIVHAHQ